MVYINFEKCQRWESGIPASRSGKKTGIGPVSGSCIWWSQMRSMRKMTILKTSKEVTRSSTIISQILLDIIRSSINALVSMMNWLRFMLLAANIGPTFLGIFIETIWSMLKCTLIRLIRFWEHQINISMC